MAAREIVHDRDFESVLSQAMRCIGAYVAGAAGYQNFGHSIQFRGRLYSKSYVPSGESVGPILGSTATKRRLRGRKYM
jgi:hypothetical protein